MNGKDNLNTTLSANSLLRILYNFNFESRNEQQDCHELFNFLISSLENEILRAITINDSLNAIQENGHQLANANAKNEITSKENDNRMIKDLKVDGDLSSLTNNKKLVILKELNSEYNSIKRPLTLKRNLPTKGNERR